MALRKVVTGVTAVAASIVMCSAAQALTVVKTLNPTYPGTISGTTTYATNETVNYKFVVAAPYHFEFLATGSGVVFPSPLR